MDKKTTSKKRVILKDILYLSKKLEIICKILKIISLKNKLRHQDNLD